MEPQHSLPNGGPKSRLITIGFVPYPVEFTANAIWHLERAFGLPMHVVGMKLITGVCGYADLQTILFAGLEGARLKYKTRTQPWTVEEVGDLIDSAGGVIEFWDKSPAIRPLVEAWRAVFPAKRPPTPGDTEGEGQAGPEGDASGTARPTETAAASTTGRRSRTKPRSVASDPTSSGT